MIQLFEDPYENEEQYCDSVNLCICCFAKIPYTFDLFESNYENMSYAEIYHKITNIKLNQSFTISNNACHECVTNLTKFYEFREMLTTNHKKLHVSVKVNAWKFRKNLDHVQPINELIVRETKMKLNTEIMSKDQKPLRQMIFLAPAAQKTPIRKDPPLGHSGINCDPLKITLNDIPSPVALPTKSSISRPISTLALLIKDVPSQTSNVNVQVSVEPEKRVPDEQLEGSSRSCSVVTVDLTEAEPNSSSVPSQVDGRYMSKSSEKLKEVRRADISTIEYKPDIDMLIEENNVKVEPSDEGKSLQPGCKQYFWNRTSRMLFYNSTLKKLLKDPQLLAKKKKEINDSITILACCKSRPNCNCSYWEMYQCKHCTFQTSEFEDFYQHFLKNEAARGQIPGCDLCKRKPFFYTLCMRNEHKHKIHPARKVRIIPELRTEDEVSSCDKEVEAPVTFMAEEVDCPKRLFLCEQCGHHTNSAFRFTDHMKAHWNDRSFPCNQCDKKFNTTTRLNIHKKSVHDKSKTFACPKCPKVFYSRRYLTFHNMNSHKEKRYSCSVCDRKFVHNNEMLKHCNRVHSAVTAQNKTTISAK